MATPPSRALLYGGIGIIAAAAGYQISKIIRGLGKVRVANCTGVSSNSGTVAGMRYLERLSPGASPEQALPMVVFFHAAATSPEGFTGFAQGLDTPARVIFLEGPVAVGGKHSWVKLPARTKNQAELEAQLKWTGERVAQFLMEIVQCRPTIGLPVVTGSSQGGHMSYLMANRYPGLVKAAVPVAGWIPKPMWTTAMATTTAFHGTQDTTVPWAWTSAEVARMKGAGAPITLTGFPVGHSVSSAEGKAWRNAVDHYTGAA